MKHLRKKKNRCLVTWRIVYRDRRNPYQRPQEITAEMRHGHLVDNDFAAAVVAVHTSIPLHAVQIITSAG